MEYDIYLGGISDNNWRTDFKKQIGIKYKIADPFVENFFQKDEIEATEQMAKDFFLMDNSKVAIFYFNGDEKGSATRLKLGNAIGSNKQVIVCVEDGTTGKKFIETYCNYHGVLVTNGMKELTEKTKELLEQFKSSE